VGVVVVDVEVVVVVYVDVVVIVVDVVLVVVVDVDVVFVVVVMLFQKVYESGAYSGFSTGGGGEI
jgi:hypothetical protein